jgi:hypothetical protein
MPTLFFDMEKKNSFRFLLLVWSVFRLTVTFTLCLSFARINQTPMSKAIAEGTSILTNQKCADQVIEKRSLIKSNILVILLHFLSDGSSQSLWNIRNAPSAFGVLQNSDMFLIQGNVHLLANTILTA